MVVTHRLLNGTWALCEQSDCPLLFHFPDMIPAQMALVPTPILLDLCELLDPPTRVRSGIKQWCQHDRLHRDYDLPAVRYPGGSMEWLIAGELHRDNGQPAAISHDGTRHWYERGKLHRAGNLPAHIEAGGYMAWHIEGLYARTDGGPCEVWPNGTLMFWSNGFCTERRLLPLRDLRA